MSTYPATIRARARSRVDHSLAIWAALGIALIGAVVVLVLTVPDRDYAPPHSQAIAPQSQAIAPDSRFDGGPNEGTRGPYPRQRGPPPHPRPRRRTDEPTAALHNP